MPNTIVTDLHCDVKYISRDHLKFDVRGNLSEPIYDFWVHTVGYYKFNQFSYQRFAVDFWDNGCDWLANKTKSYAFDWTIGRVLQYSNINHTCPYDGQIFLKINNVSIHHFAVEPLVPSGRYRVDANVTDGNRKKVLAMASAYFSVSDHRIERFWSK